MVDGASIENKAAASLLTMFELVLVFVRTKRNKH